MALPSAGSFPTNGHNSPRHLELGQNKPRLQELHLGLSEMDPVPKDEGRLPLLS